MIDIFDIEQNFWDIYPDFKIALSFKELYKSDKSRGKANSSKLMWFVAFTTDNKSKFYKLTLNERYEVIGEDYMGNPNFYEDNKEVLDKLIADYTRLKFSAAEKQLIDWEKKLDERREFINSQPYNFETFENLDKMAANTSKIYDELFKIKDRMSKEDGEGTAKGGQMTSLNDQ